MYPYQSQEPGCCQECRTRRSPDQERIASRRKAPCITPRRGSRQDSRLSRQDSRLSRLGPRLSRQTALTRRRVRAHRYCGLPAVALGEGRLRLTKSANKTLSHRQPEDGGRRIAGRWRGPHKRRGERRKRERKGLEHQLNRSRPSAMIRSEALQILESIREQHSQRREGGKGEGRRVCRSEGEKDGPRGPQTRKRSTTGKNGAQTHSAERGYTRQIWSGALAR
eukprot:4091102-Pleurochrysis_carterae.AAC.1